MLWDIIYILLALITVVTIVLVCFYYFIKKPTSSKGITDASFQEHPSFRKSVKFGGINPEKVISYGKTYFTYDSAGKKVFIQTGKNPEGITLINDDVSSFELYRDGKAVEPEALSPESALIETEHIKRSCFDLHITITLKNASEITLPLIDSPTQYEYVYIRGLDVANEIAAVLKEIINKQS